jgi:hypothetical protein
MKRLICIVTLLLLGACGAEDLDTSSSAAEVTLTKRQAAEILIRAGVERSTFCSNRDAHGAGHHLVADASYINSAILENLRAYCHEDPTWCAAAGYPGAELCQPRDCTALTAATLEAANACANAVNDDTQLCLNTTAPGCFYSILGLTPPF